MRGSLARAGVLCTAVLLAGASLIGFIGCGSDAGGSVRQTAARNTTAAADGFQLADVDGKPFDLREESKGRAHVVVFIRSDCPISNRAGPEVRELYSDFKSQGVDFYLIYVDPRESVVAIRTHLREYEYTCPALRDSKHVLATLTKATVTPEAVVFDQDWKMAYSGRINNEFEDFGQSPEKPTPPDLRHAIEATLPGRAIAEPVTKSIGCYIDDLK